jgi:signal transduction histidine kinase
MNSRARFVYAMLAAVWLVIIGWQVTEHRRVIHSARDALINRSRDITTTLGVVIRSQRFRGGVVLQERLEPALKELVKSGELSSVALLNVSGEVVASAGTPIDAETKKKTQAGAHWEDKRVAVVNPVDLGITISPEGETNRPTIVLPRRDSTEPDRTRPRPDSRTNDTAAGSNLVSSVAEAATNAIATNAAISTNQTERRTGRFRIGRPPWMDETEYKALVEKRGLHGLVVVMSTAAVELAAAHDLWLRAIICCLATVSVVGSGLAWRSVTRSSELQLRLLRASELNTHLREMNLAAAGLAHETRNPLNIIRGLAQMISKQQEASPETRDKSRAIIDETDRVSAQLNEFINYSRPREVRRSPVALEALVAEVVRALNYDIEEKNLSVESVVEPLVIEADEQLLRQALFNLLLNAVQAVDRDGEIQVRGQRKNGGAILEVRDNGPGVLPEHRHEIFKPYFTTHQKGAGLGLAVVQQIMLAHGWEIEYLANEPKGAVFRISHLKLATKS